MKKLTGLFLLCMTFGLVPMYAQAQRQSYAYQSWDLFKEATKLPPGHFDWRPVPGWVQGKWFRLEVDMPLCLEFGHIISVGKRIWEGYYPGEAVDEVNMAWHTTKCVLAGGVEVKYLREAMRSADGVHTIYVKEVMARNGRRYVIGVPTVMRVN
jgi:hypothetical protein